jgi:hypothetical protein
LGTARPFLVALSAALAPAVLALTLVVAGRGLSPDRSLVLPLLVEAVLVALAAPTLAAREAESDGSSRAPWGLVAWLLFGLVLVVAALARKTPVAPVLLAQVFLLLHGAALLGLSRAAARRLGAGAALVLGLGVGFFLLGAPYFLGDVVSALPRTLEEPSVNALVVVSPTLALPGTFFGIDSFREATLYRSFEPVQDVLWSYASPVEALLLQGVLAALALGAGALVKRLAGRRVVVAAVLLLLLAAPSRAEAQIFGGGETPGETPEGEIGPMTTRIRLGYIVPFIDGNFKVTGFTPENAPTRFDLNNDLHLNLQYAIPTFELDVGWQGAGRVWIEYWEAVFTGDFVSPAFQGVAFKNLVIPPDEIGIVNYRFRTISLNGRLDIPLLDWLTLQVILTTRYIHWETRFRAPKLGLRDVSNFDVIIPAVGPGLDVFVVDKVYLYGSIEWLDISYGGGHNLVYHYREAHAGLRLELVEAAHIGVEYYLLEVGADDSRHSYRQRIMGPKVWLEAQF